MDLPREARIIGQSAGSGKTTTAAAQVGEEARQEDVGLALRGDVTDAAIRRQSGCEQVVSRVQMGTDYDQGMPVRVAKGASEGWIP